MYIAINISKSWKVVAPSRRQYFGLSSTKNQLKRPTTDQLQVVYSPERYHFLYLWVSYGIPALPNTIFMHNNVYEYPVLEYTICEAPRLVVRSRKFPQIPGETFLGCQPLEVGQLWAVCADFLCCSDRSIVYEMVPPLFTTWKYWCDVHFGWVTSPLIYPYITLEVGHFWAVWSGLSCCTNISIV